MRIKKEHGGLGAQIAHGRFQEEAPAQLVDLVVRDAPTPQAKGKIERSMRTFQHRVRALVKDAVASAGVTDLQSAMRVVEEDPLEHPERWPRKLGSFRL